MATFGLLLAVRTYRRMAALFKGLLDCGLYGAGALCWDGL